MGGSGRSPKSMLEMSSRGAQHGISNRNLKREEPHGTVLTLGQNRLVAIEKRDSTYRVKITPAGWLLLLRRSDPERWHHSQRRRPVPEAKGRCFSKLRAPVKCVTGMGSPLELIIPYGQS